MKVLRFTQFCDRVLGLKLTNAQRVFALVAFDGLEPEQLEGRDREIARVLFGEVDTIPPEARRIVCGRFGRGSGKSTLTGAFLVYQILTADLSSCGPGDIPHVIAIAPRKRTARIIVRMARALVASAPSLAKLVVRGEDTKEGFMLRRPDGRFVHFAAFPASKGGDAVRGLTVVSFVLDEAEFFASDESYEVTDRHSYQALIPRLIPSGIGLFLSTPWPVRTLMGEFVEKNFGTPTTALVAIGTTLFMRDDDPEVAKRVELERARDPENAAREFDCVADAVGTSSFFDHNAIADAVDETIVLPVAPVDRILAAAGGDAGFVKDSSALVIVQGRGDGRIWISAIDEQRPKKGAPLKPSVVFTAWADLLAPFKITSVSLDVHYRESAREHLSPKKIAVTDAPLAKFDSFQKLRDAIYEKRLPLPKHPRLLSQLRSVYAKPLPGGGVKIDTPRRVGSGHGDILSALVLAVNEQNWKYTRGMYVPRRGGDPPIGGRSFSPNAYGHRRGFY